VDNADHRSPAHSRQQVGLSHFTLLDSSWPAGRPIPRTRQRGHPNGTVPDSRPASTRHAVRRRAGQRRRGASRCS